MSTVNARWLWTSMVCMPTWQISFFGHSLESTWLSCIRTLPVLNSMQLYIEMATIPQYTLMAFLDDGDPISDHFTMLNPPLIGDHAKVLLLIPMPSLLLFNPCCCCCWLLFFFQNVLLQLLSQATCVAGTDIADTAVAPCCHHWLVVAFNKLPNFLPLLHAVIASWLLHF